LQQVADVILYLGLQLQYMHCSVSVQCAIYGGPHWNSAPHMVLSDLCTRPAFASEQTCLLHMYSVRLMCTLYAVSPELQGELCKSLRLPSKG
jgi:hypothetical protein